MRETFCRTKKKIPSVELYAIEKEVNMHFYWASQCLLNQLNSHESRYLKETNALLFFFT